MKTMKIYPLLLIILPLLSTCITGASDEPFFKYNIGINIGNSLDSIGSNTWKAGETGWGNPRITKELISYLAGYGFKTIRLPVTWAENMGSAPDYLISKSWMDRVEQIVKWIIDEDMVCILNIHHDGGHADKSWILDIAEREDEVLFQFQTVWTQIARRFNKYSDKLILESMNEVGFDNLWNRWGSDVSGKQKAYRLVNLLNQTFVDTIRVTGGNNAKRQLLIAGYWTDIDDTCDPLFEMPVDTIEERLLVSVHYYTPSTFCIAEERNNSWGFRETWGTEGDYDELSRQINKLKDRFIDNGIPVILGEYGVTRKNKNEQSRIKWMHAVTQKCIDNGIIPVLWDTGGEINRYTYEMSDSLNEALASLK